MDTKHTPGPWGLFRSGYSARFGVEGDDEKFSVVVYGTKDEPDKGVQGRTEDEANANARLIAAAPDMLQALESVINWFADYGDEDWHCLRLAKAAHAKATH